MAENASVEAATLETGVLDGWMGVAENASVGAATLETGVPDGWMVSG